MKKVRNILIIIVLIIIAVIVGIRLVGKNETAEYSSEVPENYTYIIEIDYDTTPLKITRYYFYENMVIKEDYTGGVLPTGPSISSKFTEYEYDTGINGDNLIENVESQIHGVSIKKSNRTKKLRSVDFFDLTTIENNIDSVINKFAVKK